MAGKKQNFLTYGAIITICINIVLMLLGVIYAGDIQKVKSTETRSIETQQRVAVLENAMANMQATFIARMDRLERGQDESQKKTETQLDRILRAVEK